MPPTRRSASRPTTTSVSLPYPVPAQPPSRPVISRSRSSDAAIAKPAATKAAKARTCVGCRATLPDGLFMAIPVPKTGVAFRGKCLRCRRVDAVADFIKTQQKHKPGPPSLAAQLEHLKQQRGVMKQWQADLKVIGFEVADDKLDETMVAIKAHPTLKKAFEHLVHNPDALNSAHPDSQLSMLEPTTPSTNHRKVKHSDTASTSPSPHTIRLRMPRPEPLARLNPTMARTTAISLRSAAAALERTQELNHTQLAHVNGMFRRPFEPNTIQQWATLVSQSVNVDEDQQELWRGLDERDMAAAQVLMRMSCDVRYVTEEDYDLGR